MKLSSRFTCALFLAFPLCVEANITVHSGAKLTVNSSGALNATAVTGNSGSIITGGGALNAEVQVDGILEPLGTLRTGNLSISNTGTLQTTINGYILPGTDYDLVDVTGTVTLSPASTLALDGTGTTLPNGTRITLIENDGEEPIVGTFNGLSEASASILPGTGASAFVSYIGIGGTGNNFDLNNDDNDLDGTADSVDPDDDNDGFDDFGELAFGMDRFSADNAPLRVIDMYSFTGGIPVVAWNADSEVELSIRMVRLKDYENAGLHYHVEASEDLETWEVQNAVFTVIADAGGDYEVVEATIQVDPDSDASKHFGRVRVVDSEAYSIAIANASFEDPVLTPGASSNQDRGWDDNSTGSGTFYPLVVHFLGGEVPDGVNCAYMNSAGGNLSQTLSTTLEADTTYTLTVAVGSRFDLDFPGYGIELWAGNTLIASDYLTDSGNSTPSNGRWKDVSASYTSSASDPLIGELLEIRLIGFGIQTNYDDVRLTASP